PLNYVESSPSDKPGGTLRPRQEVDMALQPESFPDEALIEAHARIEQSEERWRSVFENSAIGVALADLNGRFIAANPVFQNMLAYTQEELERLTFIDITVEEDRELNRE